MKRQQIRPGGLFRVYLKDDSWAYGRILPNGLYAFYDARTDSPKYDIEQIIRSQVIFVCSVSDSAIKKCHWEILKVIPLEENEIEIPDFYHNPVGSNEYKIIRNWKEVPATKKDCIGLEPLAVWSAIHVENRLKDYFAGRENRYSKTCGPLQP